MTDKVAPEGCRCLIIQPVHPAGLALLRAADVEPVPASAENDDTVVDEISTADAVITRNAGLSAAAMDAAPRLAVIGVHGTGWDPVDIARADVLGLPVLSTPEANVISVAEHAMALMLAVAKRVSGSGEAVRRGDFAFKYDNDLRELTGKTLGVIGWGRIGRRFAAMAASAFNMNVLAYSPSATPSAVASEGGVKCESLDDLLEAADVVSLHVPLRQETRYLLGRRELAKLRTSAILINTGRGGTIDEEALIDALSQGRLAGAGLDVYRSEQMPWDYPLLHLNNVVLTPHTGGSTQEALQRTAEEVARGVIRVLANDRPVHMVNPHVWASRRRPRRALGRGALEL